MRPATVVLTVLVVVLLLQPLWAPEWGAGILGELRLLGPVGAIAVPAAFLAAVALYCRTLQRLAQRIPPAHRAAPPAAVWLMLAVQFNVVEDFFIVRDVARGLAADGRTPPSALRLWTATGIGWCALQVGSLVPGPAGVAVGGLALGAWAAHWVHTARLVDRLAPAAG